MTSAAGLPSTPPQRPPLSRGRKELLAALAALPVLVAAGFVIGGRISGPDVGTLKPAAGIASPLVTVVASPPPPVATVRPAAPRPLVTVKPPAPRPLVTVKPAAPRPLVTVKPAAPTPVATVRPHGPTTAPPPAAPPTGSPPRPVPGPVVTVQPPARPRALLGRGSSGADVRTWQQQMSRRGWRIRVDGIFGPQTERVARRFQHNKGLRLDGLVGPQTWNAAWLLPVIR